jgi:mono/diheme cytochrome c family protein
VRHRARVLAAVAGVLVLVVLVGAIIAIVVTGDDGDDTQLTAQQRQGRELFTSTCRQCHTLRATHAVGQVGPNLDTWAPWGIPPGVVAGAVREGRASVTSNATMPAGLLQGPDVDDVAAFVHRVTKESAHRRGGPPPVDWTPRITRTQPEDRPARPQTPPRSPDERTTTNEVATPGR